MKTLIRFLFVILTLSPLTTNAKSGTNSVLSQKNQHSKTSQRKELKRQIKELKALGKQNRSKNMSKTHGEGGALFIMLVILIVIACIALGPLFQIMAALL